MYNKLQIHCNYIS